MGGGEQGGSQSGVRGGDLSSSCAPPSRTPAGSWQARSCVGRAGRGGGNQAGRRAAAPPSCTPTHRRRAGAALHSAAPLAQADEPVW